MATREIEASVRKVTGEEPAHYIVENAQRFVVSSIPKDLMWQFSHEISISGSTSNLPQRGDVVLAARLGDYPAIKVPLAMQALVENENSLHKATETSPVYYILGGNRVVLHPKSSLGGVVTCVNYKFVDDSSDLRNAVIFRANAEVFEHLSARGIVVWEGLPAPPGMPAFGEAVAFSKFAGRFEENDPGVLKISVASLEEPVLTDYLTREEAVAFGEFVGRFKEKDPGSLEISIVPSEGPALIDYLTKGKAVAFGQFVGRFEEKDPGDLDISATSPKEPALTDYLTREEAVAFGKFTSRFKEKDPGELEISITSPEMPALGKAVTFGKFAGRFEAKDPGDLRISLTPPKEPTLTDSKIVFDASSPTYDSPKLDSRVPFKKFVSNLKATDPGDIVITAKSPPAPKIPKYNIGFKSFPSTPSIIGGIDTGWQAAFNDDDLDKAKTALERGVDLVKEQKTTFDAEIAKAKEKIDALSEKARHEDDAETQAKLTLYQAELTEYQQTVTMDIQKYTQKLEKYKTVVGFAIGTWQKEETDKLAEYQSDIQNALNEFNEKNAEYQAQLQIGVQEAQLISADDSQKMQNYANLVQSYQALVNKEVVEYQQNIAKYNLELTTLLQSWQKEETDKINIYQANVQKYSTDVQIYQAIINKEISEYQQGIAKYNLELTTLLQAWQKEETDKINIYQAGIQRYSADIQKYSANIQNYQALVNKEISAYQQNVAKYNLELTTLLQAWQKEETDKINIYQASVQKYNADVQNYQAIVNKEISAYQQDIAKYNLELTTLLQAWQKEETDKINIYQAGIQRYSADIQNYSANIQNYQALINKEISEYQQNIAKYNLELTTLLQAWQKEETDKISIYQTSVQKYNADIQKYNAQVAEESQKATFSLQGSAYYSNESKKYHELAMQEITLYIQNNSTMIGATMAARAAQK